MDNGSDKKSALLRQMLVDERTKAELKQSDVSLTLNKPQSYISKIERGERSLDLIEFLEIAAAIGFDAIDFLQRFIASVKI